MWFEPRAVRGELFDVINLSQPHYHGRRPHRIVKREASCSTNLLYGFGKFVSFMVLSATDRLRDLVKTSALGAGGRTFESRSNSDRAGW